MYGFLFFLSTVNEHFLIADKLKIGTTNSCALRIDRIPEGHRFRRGPKKVFFTIEKNGRKFVLKTALFTPVIVNRRYVFGRGVVKDGDVLRLDNIQFCFKESPRSEIPQVAEVRNCVRDEAAECPVCLDSIVDTKVKPCRHSFCKSCIAIIRLTNGRCPLCRGPIISMENKI